MEAIYYARRSHQHAKTQHFVMMTFKRKAWIHLAALLVPLAAHASYIESTIGTAVVNDATASYYNPAALVLLKNNQIITQGTVANFRTQFNGQVTPVVTGITESASSRSNTHFYSPSFYLGIPTNGPFILGLAVVSNSANRDADDNSILRYVQSSNTIQDYDVVPALALKINDFFAIGASVIFSAENFDLEPIIGFPGTNIADSQSHNKSNGTGIGGNAGFLLKPSATTVIGFNYRSRITYRLSGTSTYEGPPQIVSNNYHFKLWTPARSTFSINHFFSPKWGLISTIQYLQWSTITTIHVSGIATPLGIVDGSAPQYLRDTWVFTLGSQYRITPDWIVRVAGTYSQAPANTDYQIATGDSLILGASMGYRINKTISIDGSYAHAFLQNANINITGDRFLIDGVNKGARDTISLKLTINV